MEINQNILVGRRVRLRAIGKDDIPVALKYINDPRVSLMLSLGVPLPFRLEDEQKWYDALDPNSLSTYSFAIELLESETYIGGCGFHQVNQKNRHATVGIFLGPDFHGQGLGTEALKILVDFCFREVNLNRVSLGFFSFNPRARKCYEAVGFKQEGVLREATFRDGRYHDEIIMSILFAEWQQSTRG